MYPYQPLRRLDDGLHCVEGAFGRSPLGRRMTVVALASGGVVVHSPIRMAEPDMGALEALGPVAAVLVPNALHGADAPWYAARYPDAAVLVPRGAAAKLGRRLRVSGTLEDDWPDAAGGALECLPLGGLRTHEAAFLHHPTRTLILTDLAFNLGTDLRGPTALLLRLNDSYGRFGPTRLLRWVFLADGAALRESLRRVLERDFDRVIVSHGAVLERGGKARLAESFAWLGL